MVHELGAIRLSGEQSMSGLEVGVTKTGQTYRVQRQRGSEVIRASFLEARLANAYSRAVAGAWARNALPPSAAEFAVEVTASKPRSHSPAVPTRMDELVEYAIRMHQKDKQLSPDGVPAKMRGHWGKHGSYFHNQDIRSLTRDQVHDFARYLYEQRLARPTANEYLRLVKMACAKAVELNLVSANVASDVVGHHQDNPLRPRPTQQPRPLRPAEVKALASHFEPWLRISLFLMYVGCLRLSEAFGIEIRDWDPVDRTLKVRRQGGLAKNEGKRDPYRADEAEGRLKNRSSRRTIPVPYVLAAAIDEHIATHHGPRPHDPAAEEAWLKTRLISTPGIPKPLNTALNYRWDEALHAVGLDFQTIGYRVNRHFLRKSGSTIIGIGNIRGKLWSRYLGHQTPAEFGGSLTTVQHYFDLPDEELNTVADHWQEVLTTQVGDLVITEDWWTSPHSTITEAAVILGVHPTHVGWLLRRGHLLAAPDEEVDEWRHKTGVYRCADRIMISGPSLHAELERRRRMESTLTQQDAAQELGTSLFRVQSLRERGLLTAEQLDNSIWAYDRAPVADIARQLGEERAETASYLSIGPAARLLGVAQSEFLRTVAPGLRKRTLLLDGTTEYFRADVEALTIKRTRPGRY